MTSISTLVNFIQISTIIIVIIPMVPNFWGDFLSLAERVIIKRTVKSIPWYLLYVCEYFTYQL